MQHIQKVLDAILSKKIFEYLVIDESFVIKQCSAGLFHYLENAPMLEESVFEHFPELIGYEEKILAIMREEESFFKLQTIKKGEYWFDLYIDRYEEGKALLLLHNVTGFTVAQHRLLQYSNEQTLVRSTLEQIVEGNQMICVVDQNDTIAFANERFRDFFNVQVGDTIGVAQLQAKNVGSIEELYFQALHHGAFVSVVGRHFEVEAKPVDALYRLFLFKDITSVYNKTAELEHALNYDTLTGLLSRRAFEAAATRMIAEKRPFLFCVLDLDDFKKINDTYGHHKGDVVLQEFGTFCKSFLGEQIMIGRWGGEEFLMAIEADDETVALHLLEDFRKALETHPFENGIRVTASIGAAWSKENESFEEHFSRADKAMYRAKTEGKNRILLCQD